MNSLNELIDDLRNRIVGGLPLGQLKPGDRLPSIREVRRETGRDHRAVARAYDVVAGENLLEVRGRSGAFVATPEWVEGQMLAETAV